MKVFGIPIDNTEYTQIEIKQEGLCISLEKFDQTIYVSMLEMGKIRLLSGVYKYLSMNL